MDSDEVCHLKRAVCPRCRARRPCWIKGCKKQHEFEVVRYICPTCDEVRRLAGRDSNPDDQGQNLAAYR